MTSTDRYEKEGKNLIFLIGQPRSGTTLLQRILGNHAEVHTVSEPWILLYPLYFLKHEGWDADFGADLARDAYVEFAKNLKGGNSDYISAVQQMCQYLYNRVLEGTGKKYFLDKTPRYYLVIREIIHVFPKAKVIILFRNPIAVLCSILNTWIGKNHELLYHYKKDLLDAPSLLLEAIDEYPSRILKVYYEDLVENPEQELRSICGNLNIPFVEGILEYSKATLPRWKYGDHKTVYKYQRPDPSKANAWTESLTDPYVWKLSSEYIDMLGKKVIDKMGYSYNDLIHTLNSNRPEKRKLDFKVGLRFWLKEPGEKSSFVIRLFTRLNTSLKRRGLKETLRVLGTGALRAISEY